MILTKAWAYFHRLLIDRSFRKLKPNAGDSGISKILHQVGQSGTSNSRKVNENVSLFMHFPNDWRLGGKFGLLESVKEILKAVKDLWYPNFDLILEFGDSKYFFDDTCNFDCRAFDLEWVFVRLVQILMIGCMKLNVVLGVSDTDFVGRFDWCW